MIRSRMPLSSRVRQYLIPVVGAGLGFAGAALFLSSMDGAAVGDAFNDVTWWLILPTIFFGCVNFWLRTLRWGVLLGPGANLRTSQLAGIGLTAGLVGLILPARGGDVVKLALASRIPNLSVAQIAAAELIERCVDGVVLGTFITSAALATGTSNWLLILGILAIVIHGPIFAALPLAGRFKYDVHAPPSGSRVRRMLFQSIEAVRQTDRPQIIHAITLSAMAWGAQAMACYCLLIAFGWLTSPALPFATVGVTNFAFGVPGAPGGFGTVELPVRSLMDHFGAEPGLASAYTVTMHASILAPIPLLAAALWLFRMVRPRPQVLVPIR